MIHIQHLSELQHFGWFAQNAQDPQKRKTSIITIGNATFTIPLHDAPGLQRLAVQFPIALDLGGVRKAGSKSSVCYHDHA